MSKLRPHNFLSLSEFFIHSQEARKKKKRFSLAGVIVVDGKKFERKCNGKRNLHLYCGRINQGRTICMENFKIVDSYDASNKKKFFALFAMKK